MKQQDVRYLHNAIYVKVGEKRWAGEIKPALMGEMTRRTIRDTGNPFPDEKDVVEWVKTHPVETRDLMNQYLEPLP